MFEIKQVGKKYNGNFVLKDISFTIANGLNFIVGGSGSGKTTLLKLISGMDQKFDGTINYCGKNIKELSSYEKSYLYNKEFGFVWQDFNLLEDVSVLDNVLLPQYLNSPNTKKNAEKILKELKIFNLATKKVKSLSGGQKQRVAIARELMKNPKVLIADEPTSALDEESSKTTMDILKSIAKKRTVIIVTHDTSLINKTATVFDLDKGGTIRVPHEPVLEKGKLQFNDIHRLSIKSAFSLTKGTIKNKFGGFLLTAFTLMVAGTLMFVAVNSMIGQSSQNDFDQLVDTYGDSFADMHIVGSFIGSGGLDDSEKPDMDVTQDISGLYEKYLTDKRVEFAVFLQAFDNIKVSVDGENFPVQKTGELPSINKLIAGKMPVDQAKDIVVPESFVDTLGISNEQAIGKEIVFASSVFNWETGEPKLRETSVTATISGISDTTVHFEVEGELFEDTVDDAFLLSKAALDDIRKQAGIRQDAMNFLIRPKTPADLIYLKDELNETGIVPVGQFELVEDIVRLNEQTTEQSGFANKIIGALSVVIVVVITLFTSMMRRRDYAIYKASGYSTGHLNVLNLTEKSIETVTAIGLMFVASPLINMAAGVLFEMNGFNMEMRVRWMLSICSAGALATLITALTITKTDIATALKKGDRS